MITKQDLLKFVNHFPDSTFFISGYDEDGKTLIIAVELKEQGGYVIGQINNDGVQEVI